MKYIDKRSKEVVLTIELDSVELRVLKHVVSAYKIHSGSPNDYLFGVDLSHLIRDIEDVLEAADD